MSGMDPKEFNALEQSTREASTVSAVNAESTAGTRKNAGPSAEHLDPPTDVLKAASQQRTAESSKGPLTRLLDRSRPKYSAIGVPVPANGRTIGPEENKEVTESRMDRCINGLKIFWEWYTNTAIDFRNSCFFYFVYYMISYIPISAIIMGLVFFNECPQVSYMPIFEIVVGAASLVILFFFIIVSCGEQYENPFPAFWKIVLGILVILLSFAMFVEFCIIGHLTPSFNPSAEDYCNKTFYQYLIGKEIASTVVAVFAFLIYFPRSRLHNFCRNCSAPLPAGAIFRRNLNS